MDGKFWLTLDQKNTTYLNSGATEEIRMSNRQTEFKCGILN